MKSHSQPITLLVTIAVFLTALPGQQNALFAMQRDEPTVRISGSAGMPGVTMTGLPGDPITDQNGRYEARVPSRWSGTVAPAKEGYTFDPPQLTYQLRDASADFDNQNYAPALITYEISGTTSVGGAMIQGAGGRVYTDENGDYKVMVNYGWSGTIAPMKDGYRFNPPRRRYMKVTSNRTRQDYVPQPTRRPTQLPQITPNVLAIPSDEVDAEMIAQITEDMRIMLHLLEKAVQKDSSPRPIGGLFTDFDDFFQSTRRSPQAIYLQGYGILFLMQVDYPIVPAPATPSPQQAEHGDPTWQRARQEVFSPSTTTRPPAAQAQTPSPEDITKDLIETLRHAANIRHIEPDERVIVTVIARSFSPMPEAPSAGWLGAPPVEATPDTDPMDVTEPGADSYGGMEDMGGMMGMGGMEGMGGMAGGTMRGGMMGGYGAAGGAGYGGSGGFGGGMGGYGAMGGAYGGGMGGFGGPGGGSWYVQSVGPWWTSAVAGPQTVTTIQATKGDIDALAAGDLTIEQFCQKVKVLTY